MLAEFPWASNLASLAKKGGMAVVRSAHNSQNPCSYCELELPPSSTCVHGWMSVLPFALEGHRPQSHSDEDLRAVHLNKSADPEAGIG